MIWSFCYSKAKNVPAEKQGEFGYGDLWTYVAIEGCSLRSTSRMVGVSINTVTKLLVDLGPNGYQVGSSGGCVLGNGRLTPPEKGRTMFDR